jgi:hypothetical protein
VLLAHVQTIEPTHFGFPRTPRQNPFMRPGGEARAPEKVAAGELGTVLLSRDENYVTLHLLYKTSGYMPAAADWNVLGVSVSTISTQASVDLGLFMNIALAEPPQPALSCRSEVEV